MRNANDEMMQGRIDNIPLYDEMVINSTTESFLKRMLGQRTGMLICACPTELDGQRVIRILADHSIRLSMGHRFHMMDDTCGATEKAKAGINPETANRLTQAFMMHKPDYLFLERRIDKPVFTEMVHAVMSRHILATGFIPAPSSFIALERLAEVASSPTILANVLNGILALNYINIICPNCKTELPPAEIPDGLIITGEMDGARLRQFKGTGCPSCAGTGYSSYDILAECLDMSAGLRDAILKGSGRMALKKLAKAAGTLTFLDTAWAFFRSGLTSLDEVKRIAAVTK